MSDYFKRVCVIYLCSSCTVTANITRPRQTAEARVLHHGRVVSRLQTFVIPPRDHACQPSAVYRYPGRACLLAETLRQPLASQLAFPNPSLAPPADPESSETQTEMRWDFAV